MEPGEKSVRPDNGCWRFDREVFREIEICPAPASKVPTDLVEVRRHHAADGLGLYAILGLAIRPGICPAPVRA